MAGSRVSASTVFLVFSPSSKGETRQLAKSRKPIWWIRLASFLVICESAMVRLGSSGVSEEWIVSDSPLKIQILETLRRGCFECSSGCSIGSTFHMKRY